MFYRLKSKLIKSQYVLKINVVKMSMLRSMAVMLG